MASKQNMHWHDINALDDRDFLCRAYVAILGREPDSLGLARYLDQLRIGRRTRAEVVWSLLRSREGVACGRSVRGLWWRLVSQRVRLRLVRFLFPDGALVSASQDPCRPIEGSDVFHAEELDNRLKRLETINEVLEDAIQELSWRIANGHIEERISEIHDNVQALRQGSHVMEDDICSITTVLSPIAAALRRRGMIEADEKGASWLPSKSEMEGVFVALADGLRGDYQDIIDRLRVYAPELRAAQERSGRSGLLDLGCGRGEMLHLARELGLDPFGVDHNEQIIEMLRGNGFRVQAGDMFDVLAGQEDDSLAVISAIHVVEHLELPELVALIREARRALAPGGSLIIETPNVYNIKVGACDFWNDPSHLRPLPYPLVQTMMRAGGFDHVAPIFLHEDGAALPEDGRVTVEWNSLIHGHRDLGVIAQLRQESDRRGG